MDSTPGDLCLPLLLLQEQLEEVNILLPLSSLPLPKVSLLLYALSPCTTIPPSLLLEDEAHSHFHVRLLLTGVT